MINAKYFGAIGNGIADDHAAIQKAIDFIISRNNKYQTLYLPTGKYRITKPLSFKNPNGSFFTLEFSGETKGMFGVDNFGSTIIADFKTRSAIELQLAKGCMIRNLEIVGKYTPPTLTDKEFYNIGQTDYSDDGCENTRNSIYSAITIDPDASGSAKGSTGCRFENIIIRKFISSVTVSPNGSTRNAEILLFDGLQVENCKHVLISTQDQEKQNTIRNLSVWGQTHTMFVFNQYGAGTPGHWVVDGVNIAGRVNSLIYRKDKGYYPMHFTNVFAESLGRIGTWEGSMGSTISNSVFDFQEVQRMGEVTDVLNGQLIFNNSVLRYYGPGNPVVLNGKFTFNNCKFDTPPIVHGGYDVPQSVYEVNNYKKPVGTNLGPHIVSDTMTIEGTHRGVVTFVDMRDQYRGAGLVTGTADGKSTIQFIGKNVIRGTKHYVFVWN